MINKIIISLIIFTVFIKPVNADPKKFDEFSQKFNQLLKCFKNEFKDEILVKVRSTGKLLNAKISFKDLEKAEVNLKISEDGISPGQACVFYKKDNFGYKVLGGGWITN